MTVYDFSSGFNLLNQGINSLGEALNNRTNAQGYSGIGHAVQSGDWDGAAARAWSMGNPDLAMKLWQQGYAMRGAAGYPTTTPADGSAATPATLTSPAKQTDAPQPSAPSAPSAPSTGGRLTAGMRNNNPFNISLPFQGADAYNGKIVGLPDQPGYAQFPDMATGYQAGAARLSQYITQGHGSSGPLNTIGKLGPIYAQDPGWAASVSRLSGIPANQPLDPFNGPQMAALQRGIILQEQGAGPGNAILGQVKLGSPQVAPAQPAAPAATPPAAPAAGAVPPRPGPNASPAEVEAWQKQFEAARGGASADAAPTLPRLAQATPLPPPATIPPAAAAALPAARPAMPAVPAGGVPTAQAYAGIPLNAPEQGVDAAARALATNLPGAPSPQQQAAAAANPPGLGDLFRLLTGQPNAPAAPQPPAPGASPGQPQPATAPAPTGPAAQLQPIVQALQSGRVTMRELLANPSAYGLPDPRSPQGQPVWQVLGQAATSTGRPAGLGPPTPAMGAQAFGGARADATSTGNAPLPPARPSDFGQPPAQMGADESQAGRGPGRNALEDANAGRLPGYPENAPLPPVRPPDIGKPFPVAKAPPASSPVPAAIQPKSATNAPVPRQGPYAPPGGPGSAFNRDFGPGAGQMWGPSGGVMAAGRGGITPSYLGGPTPQGVTPEAIAAARNAFMQPGGGTVPAALPPRGAPAPGAGGALGGALAGLGGGLLNMLSMTPPQGVPGINTPAQYLQGGQGAPLPAPPWLAQRPQGQAPGVLPSGLPAAGAGAPLQPGVGAQPAAQPAAAPGAPAAAPADPIDSQIAAATARMQQMRSIAVARSPLGEAYAKPFEDEANRMQELVNELTKQKTAAGYKVGETTKSTQDEMAKEGLKNISTAYGGLSDPGGPKGLLSNVYQMKADLDAGAIQGWGGAQGMVQHLAETLAAFDLVSSGKVANTQQIQDLAPQETMRLARMLVGKNRLTNKDIALLQQGQLNLGQRPEVVRGMLDMAAKMATDQIDTHNTAVDRFAEANPAYGNAAKIQYKFDKSTLPKPEDFKAVGGQAGGALKAPNPDTLAAARAQIAAGKPKADVENFMRLHGFDPSGL